MPEGPYREGHGESEKRRNTAMVADR